MKSVTSGYVRASFCRYAPKSVARVSVLTPKARGSIAKTSKTVRIPEPSAIGTARSRNFFSRISVGSSGFQRTAIRFSVILSDLIRW